MKCSKVSFCDRSVFVMLNFFLKTISSPSPHVKGQISDQKFCCHLHTINNQLATYEHPSSINERGVGIMSQQTDFKYM